MNFLIRTLSAFVLIFLFFQRFDSISQKVDPVNDIEYDPLKFKLVVTGGALFYAGTLTGLYSIWYNDYERTSFHWFNDNSGWMQIDKFGHAYTAYIFGRTAMKSLYWSGVSRKKAIWYGGSFGFVFLSSVEFLDGHYEAWGASVGDLLSNAGGAALLIGQELALGKQALTMKFSYNPSPIAEYRPDVLGEGELERIIKDYNGQTYWFSLNYNSVFKNHTIIPKWFNIAGGYSAYGMLGADENPIHLPEVERYRRYLISLDVDFDKIKSKSKVVNSIFYFLNLIKVPFPTIEINSKGEVIFHPVYF